MIFHLSFELQHNFFFKDENKKTIITKFYILIKLLIKQKQFMYKKKLNINIVI